MWSKIKSFLLVNTSTRQTVAKNAFWLTVSNFGGRLLRALVIVYAARILGAGEWGIFNYAITVAAFLSIFSDIGINSILFKEVARTEGSERDKIVSTSFYIKLVLASIALFLVLVIAPYFTAVEGAKALYPIVGLILLFDILRDFGFAYLKGVERMEGEAFLYILTNLGIVGFGFAFLMISPTVEAFTMGYAAGAFLGMAATYFLLRKKFKNIFLNFSKEAVAPILKAAWPFALVALMAIFLTNTDILVLGWSRSAEEIGLYSAALRIVQLLYLVPGIIGISMLPAFSRLANRDDEKMRWMVERGISFSFGIAIPAAIGGIILASPIMGLVFGAAFIPAAISFQILMLTLIVDFPANILSYVAFAHNRQTFLTKYSAIAAFSNVILDLILIPKYGIAGSAFGTLIAQILSNLYLWYAIKGVAPFTIMPHLKKIIMASALMGITSWFLGVILNLPVIFVIPVSIALYLGVLVFLKEPLLSEMRSILRPGASAGPVKSELPAV